MSLKELSLAGKIAIVTGGGRGYGKAIALAFAESGADVTLAARTVAEIEQTAQEVRQLGRKALAVPTDVTKAEQVQRMVEKTISEFRRIDILVNNAGRGLGRSLVPMPDARVVESIKVDEMHPEEEWQSVMDLNLKSIFLCCRAVGPYMIKQGGGKVINITSTWAKKPASYTLAYCCSKAAAAMFTQCLALEWARYNICVNAIGPGMAKTKLVEDIFGDEARLQKTLRAIPLRRPAEVREIALLAVYFASDASNYITGQNIYIDGGMVIT